MWKWPRENVNVSIKGDIYPFFGGRFGDNQSTFETLNAVFQTSCAYSMTPINRARTGSTLANDQR